jgi:hypothetical protein
LPVIGLELPFHPTTAISEDPVRDSPASDPDNVPRPLLKSTEVVADAKVVSPKHDNSITLRKPSFTGFIEDSSLTGGRFRLCVVMFASSKR